MYFAKTPIFEHSVVNGVGNLPSHVHVNLVSWPAKCASLVELTF